MPRNALLGLATAVITTLGMTAGAAADVVPLQGDALAPNAVWADPWNAATDDADPLAELLAVDSADEGPAPLLELLGMPTQVRRKAGPYAGAAAEPGNPAVERNAARLPAPAALEDDEDGVASMGRKALEVFEGLGVAGGSADSYSARPSALAEPVPAQASAPAEVQESWLRDALQQLRRNREWVVMAVAAIVLGMLATRASSMWSQGRSRPAAPARSAPRAPVPSRQGSR